MMGRCAMPSTSLSLCGLTNTRRGQVIPQMTDVLLAAHTAVVGPVQGADDAVQLDSHTRAMSGFDGGAQVVQQGLDIAPVNVAAQGFLEDGLEQAFVVKAHRDTLLYSESHHPSPAGQEVQQFSHIGWR